ncbi:spondin domain-containing protein [Caldithrix abyssi]
MRHLLRASLMVLALALVWACNQEPAGVTSQTLEQTPAVEPDRAGRFTPPDLINTEFEFEITIENLTPATGDGASQPFSPLLLTTHTPFFHLYRVGDYASEELAQIARDAVSGPMVEQLNQSPQVFDVAQGDGVILPGGKSTLRIKAKPGFHKLSAVTMLVNTNDAFAGLDAVRLPRFGTAVYYLKAYDAGSEKNTELAEHIPGPCCGNPFKGIPTHERIKLHKGIKGIGDLDPAVYGWQQPVAKLTIRMVQ